MNNIVLPEYPFSYKLLLVNSYQQGTQEEPGAEKKKEKEKKEAAKKPKKVPFSFQF
jgi:hypothetical protein